MEEIWLIKGTVSSKSAGRRPSRSTRRLAPKKTGGRVQGCLATASLDELPPQALRDKVARQKRGTGLGLLYERKRRLATLGMRGELRLQVRTAL